jgi:hypothetical protein
MPRLREKVSRPKARSARERVPVRGDNVGAVGMLLAFIGVLASVGLALKMGAIFLHWGENYRIYSVAAALIIFIGFLIALRRAIKRGIEG